MVTMACRVVSQALKLYAWEDSFKERVLDIREDELQSLKKAAYLNAGSALSWFMAPYLVSPTITMHGHYMGI